MKSLFLILSLLALLQHTAGSPAPAAAAATPTSAPKIVNFPNGTIEMVYFGNVAPAIPRDLNILNGALEDRSLICKLDAILLACKALAAKATPFCSSYLHIPTSTSVVVIRPTTTTTETDYVTTLITANAKRGVKSPAPSIAIPPGLAIFAAAQISSACSCLSIQPTATTTTTTAPLAVITTTTTITTTSTLPPPPPPCKPQGAPGCNLLDINDVLLCCNQCCLNYNGDPTNGECCPFQP